MRMTAAMLFYPIFFQERLDRAAASYQRLPAEHQALLPGSVMECTQKPPCATSPKNAAVGVDFPNQLAPSVASMRSDVVFCGWHVQCQSCAARRRSTTLMHDSCT